MPVSKLKKVHNLYDELYEEFKGFFSTDQLKSLEKCFLKADLDGDHLLNQTELKYWMEKHAKPISQRELRCILQEVDVDHDGFINFREFLTLCLKIGIRKILKEEFPEAAGKGRVVANFSGIINYFEKKAHSESEIRSSTSADYRNRLQELYGNSECKKLENMFDSETQSLAGENTDYGTDNDETGHGNGPHYENHDGCSYNNSPCCSSESETSVVGASNGMHDVPNNCNCCACNYKNENAGARKHSANGNTHKELSNPQHDDNFSIPQHHQHRVSENHEKFNPLPQPSMHDERLENPVHKENHNVIQEVGHLKEIRNIYTGNNNYCTRNSVENKRNSVENKRNSLENKRNSVENKRNSVENKRNSVENKRNSVENKRNSVENKRNSVENKRNSVEGNTVGHNNLHSDPPQSHKPMHRNSNGDRHDGEIGIPQNMNGKKKDYCLSTTQYQKHKNSTEMPHRQEEYVPHVDHLENVHHNSIHPPNPSMRHNSNGDHRHEGDFSRIKNEKKNYCLSGTQIQKPRDSKEISNPRNSKEISNPRNSKEISNREDEFISNSNTNVHVHRNSQQQHQCNNVPDLRYAEGVHSDHKSHIPVREHGDKLKRNEHQNFHESNTPDTHYNPERNYNDKYCQDHSDVANPRKKFIEDTMNDFLKQNEYNRDSINNDNNKYCTNNIPQRNESPKYQRNSMSENEHHVRSGRSRRHTTEGYPTHSSPVNISEHKTRRSYEGAKNNHRNSRESIREQPEFNRNQSARGHENEFQRSELHSKPIPNNDFSRPKGNNEYSPSEKHLIAEYKTTVKGRYVEPRQFPSQNTDQMNRGDKWKQQMGQVLKDIQKKPLEKVHKWEKLAFQEMRRHSLNKDHDVPHQHERHDKYATKSNSNDHHRSTIENGYGISGMEQREKNKSCKLRNVGTCNITRKQSKKQHRSTIEDGHGLAGMENWEQNKPKEDRKNSAGNGQNSPHHSRQRRSIIEDGHGLAGMEDLEHQNEDRKNSAGAATGHSNPPPRHSKDHRRSTIEDGHGLAGMENWEQNKRRSTIEEGHGLAGMENWEQNKETRKNSAGTENGPSNPHPRNSKEHRRSTIEDGHGLAGMENWEKNKTEESSKNSRETENRVGDSEEPRHGSIENGKGPSGIANLEQNQQHTHKISDENQKHNNEHRDSKNLDNFAISSVLEGVYVWEANHTDDHISPRRSKEHRRSTIEDGYGIAGMEQW